MTRTRRARRPGSPAALTAVDGALAEVAAGRPIVVLGDGGDAEGEPRAELVLAAATVTPELLAFAVRHTSGFVCVALPASRADQLDLPPMTAGGGGTTGSAFTVTVDAADGAGTGISATDRAHTIRLLADPGTGPAALRRPGHVVPVRVDGAGVLGHAGCAEAAVDLARLAGLPPAAAVCRLVNDDGTVAGRADVETFCARHGILTLHVRDLVRYRRTRERQVTAGAEARIPTSHGVFRAVGFADLHSGAEHVALVLGDPAGGGVVPVGVHTECLAGDVVGSLRCRCRARLDGALEAVAREGGGVVLYLRPEEPGGVLGTLQAHGTRSARPGLAGQLLGDLGVRAVRLLDDDAGLAAELQECGLDVVPWVEQVEQAAPVAGALALAAPAAL